MRRENILVATKLWAPIERGGEEPMTMTDDKKDSNGSLDLYGLSRKRIFENIDGYLGHDIVHVDDEMKTTPLLGSNMHVTTIR